MFYYSNDIGELLAQSKTQKKLNINAVRMLLEYGSVPYDETLFNGIKRLPPGHFMTVDKNKNIKIVRYWKPENIKINNSISEEGAQEKFLEIFENAITDRIRNISQTSFELSGGLDSSSIVSITKHIYPKEKIHTNSMIFGALPLCDESDYIDSMSEKYDLDINKVSINNLDYKDKYSMEYNYRLDPYWPTLITHTMLFPVAEKLKMMGINRVLTGQGGDQVLAGNYYVVFDYFKQFKWISMYKEFKAVKKPMILLKKYIISPGLTKKQKKFIKSILNFVFLHKTNMDNQKPRSKKDFYEISEQFSKDHYSFWNDLDSLTNTKQTLYLDTSSYHVMEKHYGITYTHPFYDRRLIEFMLSLPAKFKYRERVTKVLLRKAMQGILPEKIRLRRDKAEFTAVLKQQIDAIDLDVLLGDTYLAKLGLIDQAEIDKLKEDYQSGRMKTVLYFWKIINLEYWYRYNFVNNKEKV